MVANIPTPLWVDHGDGNGQIRNPDVSDDAFAAGLVALTEQNIDLLWNAATNYQEAQISGAAVGLVTMGVMQQKPKSLAVMGWINSIWSLYYTRKPQIAYHWDDAMYDFSSCGPMPCTVPDLMAEVTP